MNINMDLLVLKGLISDMPEETQQQIMEFSETLRNLVLEKGKVGMIAYSLVGLELQESEA